MTMPEPMEMADESRERQGMTEDELLGIVRDEMMSAVGHIEDYVEQRRARLLRGYLGAKLGNEVDGYSHVVSRDIYEAVEWAIPQLVETFLAGDRVARFDPTCPEDEDEAMQQTDLANHVFLKDNNGFLVLSTAIKDALIQEIGVIYWEWVNSDRVEYEFYEGLTPEQIQIALQQNDDVQVSAAQPSQITPGTIDVEFARTFRNGKLEIHAIPPEEFIYSGDARSVDDARMVGRLRRMTASDLIEMGIDPEIVEELNGDGGIANTSGELARISRDAGLSASIQRNNRRDSEREIDLAYLWIRVDFDGDGISELRKVVVASNGQSVTRLISHEPAQRKPFAVMSPVMMPHRLAGISLAETIEDIALTRTAVLRAYLDALYLAQRPRTITLGTPEDGPSADQDELMSVVPGANVTEYVAGAIRPFPYVDTSATSLAGIEMLKGMREERTGITRNYQGVEAPHSMNDTMGGMQMLQNAAGKRLAFIARLIAECGVKPLFTGIAAELKQHQRIPKTLRLRGKWVNVDPTEWKSEYDATVEVGLGYGDRDQAMFGVQQIMALQEKLAGYPQTAAMVTPEKIWESIGEFCKQVGFKNAARFFEDPQGKPPADPGPSIEEMKLQLEAQAKQKELELREKEIETRELEIRLKHELEMLKLGIPVRAPQPDPVGMLPVQQAPPMPTGQPMPQQIPPELLMADTMPPEAYRA